MHAFVYRCGARLSFEEFCKMDADFVDKIGKDSYGRQWNRFGKKKQLEKAFEAVSEDEQRQDGLEASNFDSFVKVLEACIGDKDNQTSLIESQVDVALKRMQELGTTCDFGAELLLAHKNLVALGKSVDHLPKAFWKSFKRLTKAATDGCETKLCPELFAHPMGQLHNYGRALQSLQWPAEMEEVVKASNELTLQYVVQVTEESEALTEKSAADQSLILGSMLLCSSETAFNSHFGFVRLHLESKYTATKASHRQSSSSNNICLPCNRQMTVDQYGVGTTYCGSCRKIYIEHKADYCPYCTRNGRGNRMLSHKKDGSGFTATCSPNVSCGLTFHVRQHYDHKIKVAEGRLVPVDDEAYARDVTVRIPDSLDDPEHFGHVLWKCCQVLKDAGA